MAKPVRFGILGAGSVAAAHARAIGALGEAAELVAVASQSEQRARSLAEPYGARVYAGYDQLLEADLDAVSICTPSGTHAHYAMGALQANKHVVIEKPLDVSLEAADRLIRVQRQSGQKATVISQYRWSPATQELRRLVQEQGLGRLVHGDAALKWYRPQSYYDSAAWRGTRELDGGCLMNQGIHTLDQLLWVMGPVAAVTAYTGTLTHEGIDVEDVAVAVLRYESGALGALNFTTNAYPGLSARIEIHGTGGSARLENEELAVYREPGALPATYGGREQHLTGGASDPMAISELHPLQYRDFLAALAEDRDPLITLEEGRRTLATVLACYESARTGREVRL